MATKCREPCEISGAPNGWASAGRHVLRAARANDRAVEIVVGKSIHISPWTIRWKGTIRSEEHTSELQSLMRISYAVFCLKKKKTKKLSHRNHMSPTKININK